MPDVEDASKTVSVTYLGPAHFIEHKGKMHEPGAVLDMTLGDARDLQRRGHSLAGLDSLAPNSGSLSGVDGLQTQREAIEAANEPKKGDLRPGQMTPEETILADAKDMRREVREARNEPRDKPATPVATS